MSTAHAMPQHEFGALFSELMATRAHYETLRINGAPFDERAQLLDRLHHLRHDMGVVRRSLG